MRWLVKLEIDVIADAVLAGCLDLIQHEQHAGAPWIEACVRSVKMICRDNLRFTETESSIQLFNNHFILVSQEVTSADIAQIGTAVNSAVNCGYHVAVTEYNQRWLTLSVHPSAEAETLLAAVSESLEAEMQRKWSDLHTAKLRTVAMMFGYLIGRNGVETDNHTINEEYLNKWIFVRKSAPPSGVQRPGVVDTSATATCTSDCTVTRAA